MYTTVFWSDRDIIWSQTFQYMQQRDNNVTTIQILGITIEESVYMLSE